MKRAKVTGVEHTSYKGKTVAARQTGEDCRYSMDCMSSLFTDEEKRSFIDKMNSLESKTVQDTFLQGLMETSSVIRRRPRSDENRKKEYVERSSSCKYFVMAGNCMKVQVCAKAFSSLYGVHPSRVRRIRELLQEGKSPTDQRGKHDLKRRRIDPKWVTAMDEHIRSFPTKKTHYQTNVKEYLDEKLNVKIMFNLFREKHPDSKVKYKFYLKHFNENFGLSFGRPQVDT